MNIQLKDSFIRSEDPPDFEGGRTSPFIWNSPGVDAAYDISSRLTVGLGYEYETKRYDRTIDRIDDYDGNGLSGQVSFRIRPRISLEGVYRYHTRDYEKRPLDDNDSNRLEGGITWEIGPKSTGTARVGYMRGDYDRSDRTDEAVTYYINLVQQLKPKTALSIEGVREIQDTSAADDNLAFSNDYVSTQISGTLSHHYREFTGRLTLAYIHDDYLHDDVGAGEKRKDDLIRGEFGIDYALKEWLTLGGSYRHSRLNSNFFKTEEYEENVFLVFVTLVL